MMLCVGKGGQQSVDSKRRDGGCEVKLALGEPILRG